MSKSENPPIYVIRRGSALYGEMQADRTWIEEQPANMRIKVSLHTGRSPSKLRWYWAFLGRVVKATECAPTTDALHNLIKMETGFTTPVKLKGYIVLTPASISFNSMKESDFDAFLEGAVRFISQEFGITPEMAFDGEAA